MTCRSGGCRRSRYAKKSLLNMAADAAGPPEGNRAFEGRMEMRRLTGYLALIALVVLASACATSDNTNTNHNTTVTSSPSPATSPANANVHDNMNASEHANMANHNVNAKPK